MNDFVYRFRSIEKFLGFKELETQSIYFCHPNDLNDPVENFKDIIWHGDKILWSNLFRNYLICLYSAYSHISIFGEEHLLKPEDIPVFSTYDKLPTQKYKDIITNLFQEFFENESIKNLIEGLSIRENVRRGELLFFLESVHMLAISLIQKQDELLEESKRKLVDTSKVLKGQLFTPQFFKWINKIKKETNVEYPEEKFFSISGQVIQQTKILTALKSGQNEKNKRFYLLDFPKLYVRQIEELLFWPWYTACFSNTASNSSMWGYYAEGHNGICLKFKTTKEHNKRGIFLRTITSEGWSKTGGISKGYGNVFFPLYDINYEVKVKPISFFQSIGRLSFPDLISQWHSEGDGNTSPLVQDIFKKREEWHKNYWKTFLDNIPIKTPEWRHEEESRLIHHSLLSGTIPKEERVLNYSFKDLDGIIFGINTSEEHKIEIMRIVHDVCQKEKRFDFNFYQASYNSFTGKIDIHPLNLIKITENETTV